MTPGPPRMPVWCWAGLALVLLFDLWWRGHTVGPTLRDRYGLDLYPVTGREAEPLDCDEAIYAYIGKRIDRGDVMYRDLTENKPPGGYWLYALAVGVGGADEFTVRIMPLPFVLATTALVWWLGLRLHGPGSAVLGAWLYAILSTDPYLFGNGANMEHFLNLFAAGSLALMVRAWGRPGRATMAAAGACVGAAALVKQVAGLHLLLYGFALMIRGDRTWKERARDVLALVAGFAAVWVVAVGVLVAQGAGRSAFDDIVSYGGALATDTPPDPNAPPWLERWITGNADPQGRLPWPFGRTDYLVWWGTGSWPLWLAAVPAVGWLLAGPSCGPRRLLAGWTLSAWVQVAAPRLFWQHYYLLPTPGVAACVALLLADAWSAARRRPAKVERDEWARATAGPRRALALVAALALAAAVAWTAVIQVRDYLLVRPQALTERYKGGRQWVALRDLGRAVGRRSRAWVDPRLYVWGWQSPLYIYSGLDSVSRHAFADPLLKAFAEGDHPLIRPRVGEIMDDLRARPPELLFAGDPPFPALRRFLEERGYRRSGLGPVIPDGRGLWVEPRRFEAFESPGPFRPE